MKSLVINLFLLFSFFSYGQQNKCKLEISTYSKGGIVLGESIKVNVYIYDSELGGLFTGKGCEIDTAEDFFESKMNSRFSYSFKITPTDTGKVKIGPYSLKYKDEVLESNIIYVNANENYNKKCLSVSAPEKAKVNKEVTVTVSSNGLDLFGLILRETDYLKARTSGSNNTTSIKNGKKEVSSSVTYKVQFTRKGIYEISPNLFNKYSQYFCKEPIKIKVK